MTNSAENKKETKGVFQSVTSLPLSGKLFLLILIALIPRIIIFFQPEIITIDGTLYIKMARLFSEGKYGGTPGSYFSLYPFLIFLLQKLVGDWELSGQLISIAFGTLTVIPIFLLGRSLYDERIGWLSALFYTALPHFLKFNSQVIRDPVSWFLIAVTLWLVWEGFKKNQLIYFGVASVSAGLGALTRVEGFIVWGALGFYIGFKKVMGISIKRKILNLCLFIVIFPLLLSMVLFFIKKPSSEAAAGEMASFSLNFIAAHARTILRPQDPIDTLGEKTYHSLPMIPQNALELASRHRIVLAISEVTLKFFRCANFLIILILLGLWKRKKEGFISSDLYQVFTFIALFLMSIFYARQLYYFSTRHGLTLVLACLFFAGHGLDVAVGILSRAMDRIGSGWCLVRRYLPLILTFLLILLFLFQGLGLRAKGKEKTTIKESGLWLREKGYQGSVIMGPKSLFRLAFYADGKFIEIPNSWEKVPDRIRKNQVKIVVVDSCSIDEDCPGFLGNWPQAGLSLLNGLPGKEENCPIHIYIVK